MSGDYLLAIGPESDPSSGSAGQSDGRSEPLDFGWGRLHLGSGVPIRLLGRSTFLIGSVFDRSGAWVADADLERAAVDALGNATTLLTRYWGRYLVGVCGADGRIGVLRDPTGAVPCFWLQQGARLWLASDARRLLQQSGSAPALDRLGLGQALRFPDLRTKRTAIASVRELPPGAMLAVDSSPTTRMGWPPVRKPQASVDPETSPAALRQTVALCVGTQLGPYERPLLQLSGGLDSSILAVTLRLLGREAVAINVATPDAEGDERRFARLVAERTGMTLIEHVMSPAEIDIEHPTAAHLPRPTRRLFAQAVDALTRETALKRGCDLVLSGGGGDNVFGFLPAGVPTADAMGRFAPASIVQVALAEAEIYGVDLWSILKAAGTHRLGPRRWPEDRRFLHPSLLDTVAPTHPWLADQHRLALGRSAHLASLALIQNFTDALDRSRWPTLFPLLSQPVMELCLAVRTRDWVAGGQNRALARAAFADLLPDRIRHRRGKGGYIRFAARLFELNRPRIRDLLLGGVLATERYLDRPELERWFAGGAVPNDNRLLSLVEAETWARHWVGGDGPASS